MKRADITIAVNGRATRASVEVRTTLVDFLRDELRLTGTHVGCEHGVCGACSVLFDGSPVRACLMFAPQAAGHEITTVEGLCKPDGSPGILQDSFQEEHGMQCGYCTPGMLISAQALLNANPAPTREDIREAIGANLCRCTGYVQIVESIATAAERLRKGGA